MCSFFLHAGRTVAASTGATAGNAWGAPAAAAGADAGGYGSAVRGRGAAAVDDYGGSNVRGRGRPAAADAYGGCRFWYSFRYCLDILRTHAYGKIALELPAAVIYVHGIALYMRSQCQDMSLT